MTARPGEIYWVQPEAPDDQPHIAHPHVIIQAGNADNKVVACALTSNLSRVAMPGNVLLDAGEAGLPRQSVVEVSKISTLDPAQLGNYIGTLSDARLAQILAGIRFVQRSFLRR